MLNYAAIVPHSPLLSPSISQKQVIPAKANDAFKQIATELKKRGIKHLVTIGAHPRFHRHHFSAYIADQYTIQFSEFGDLITQIEAKPWKKAYHQLRERIASAPLEVLSSGDLDYTHGIPLLHLLEEFPAQEQLSILAVNDSSDRSLEERKAFGVFLRASLDVLKEPYAILCSGDLYVTTNQSYSKDVHYQNKQIKKQLEKSLDVHEDQSLQEHAEIKSPTLFSTLPILSGAIGETSFEQRELLFESIVQTSFYIGDLTF